MSNFSAQNLPFDIVLNSDKAKVLIVFPNYWLLRRCVDDFRPIMDAAGYKWRWAQKLWCKEGSTVRLVVAEKGLLQELAGLILTHVFFIGITEARYPEFFQSIIRAPEGRDFLRPMGLYYIENYVPGVQNSNAGTK